MKLLLLAATLIAGIATARNPVEASNWIEISFDFHVGDAFVPAGEYRIQHSIAALTLRTKDGRIAARYSFSARERERPTPALSTAHFTCLEFRRYGGAHFLAKV